MIPLLKPSFPEFKDIRKYFKKSVEKSQYSNFGPNYWSAKSALDQLTRRKNVLVSNGTQAISLAVKMLMLHDKVREGARVFIPDFTHYGSVAGVLSAGLKNIRIMPVNENWIIDEQCLLDEIIPGDVVIVVAPFGHLPDVWKWNNLAGRKGFNIVYDFAGAFGDFSYDTEWPVCYSLHATKGLCTGEGGFVSLNSELQHKTVQLLCNFGTGLDRKIHLLEGENAKMDELRCAMLNYQLDHLGAFEYRMSNRRVRFTGYQKELGLWSPQGSDKNPSLLVFEFPNTMSKVETYSAKNGFVAKQYYIPLSLMDALVESKKLSFHYELKTPLCYALPCDVTYEEQEHIIKCLRKIL